MNSRLVLIFLFLSFSLTIAQKKYFISNDGKNTNSGASEATAWKTISKVNSASLPSGTVVAFKSGNVFSDAPLEAKTGVVYTSYGSGKAVIGDSSNVSYTHWVEVKGDNATIDNLYIFGTNKTGNTNANAVIINGNNATIKNCKIRGGSQSYVYANNMGINVHKTGAKIQNNDISYFPYGIGGGNPSNVTIDGNKIHNIYFERSVFGSGGEGIHLWSNLAHNANNLTPAWDCNYTVVIKNNEIYDYERWGITTTSLSHCIIEYNEFHDNKDERVHQGGIYHGGAIKLADLYWGSMVYPGSLGNIFRYNIIHDLNRHQVSRDYTLHNGSTYHLDTSPNAISGGSGISMEVYGNLMYNTGFVGFNNGNGGSALAKSYNYDPYSIKIYNNTFYNVAGDSAYGWGGAKVINAEGIGSKVYIKNNIIQIAHPKGYAIFSQVETITGNNIFVNRSGVIEQAGADDGNPTAAIYVNTSSGSYTAEGGANQDNTNPLFVSPATGDFHLQAGSPAIDAGVSLGNDKNGSPIVPRGYVSGAVEIGAYETITGGFKNNTSSNIKPIITQQPIDINITKKNSATFTVSALCSDAIGYQWWRVPFVSVTESKISNSSKYLGATSNTLIVQNVNESDNATKYLCEIYNITNHSSYWVNSNTASLIIDSKNTSTNNNSYIRVLLEGAITKGEMSTILNRKNLLPKLQPYNKKPFNYLGSERVDSFNSNVVDWLLVELRRDLRTIEQKFVALLSSDGIIYNLDGTRNFSNNKIADGSYYLVIHHRNHLSVMSKSKVRVENSIINYDFTTSVSKAYGTNSMVELSNGKYAMYAGNGDSNKMISKLDFGIVANSIFANEYNSGDIDLDGVVNVLDYSRISKNISKKSNVP